MRRFFRAIARIFAFARATLGNLIVLAVAAVATLVVVGIVSGPSRPEMEADSALLLAPDGAIVERPRLPRVTALLDDAPWQQTTIRDLLEAIEQAADDHRVKALVFDLSDLQPVARPHLEVLGEALTAFREGGKTIVAKSDFYNQSQYYLASFADEIYMHPMGEVGLSGYGMVGLYYRDLLDKLKVNVHVFRVGTYKAAVEPFIRNDMSADAQEANQALVDSVWRRYVDTIAANRKLDADAILAYANRYDELLAASNGDTAQTALQHGLVDQLLTKEGTTERLSELTGGEDFRHVALADYLEPSLPPMFGDSVAVITATGTIVMDDMPDAIGARATVRLLRQAREDNAVKAVVLRVDSPGGSAFASELIRQEVDEVRASGKPVVVSMAEVAASGGYWISASADEIWASPTTLTGSIGIFGILPTVEDSLLEIGINQDGVTTGPFAGGLDPFSALDSRQARALQANIDFGYRQFVKLVAEGRDMTFEDVDAIAQGRVWTGEQAQELGLVDELGHLEDAIASAAQLAGLSNYNVRHLEEDAPVWQFLAREALEVFVPHSRTDALSGRLASELLGQLRFAATLDDPKHAYALCEMCRWR